MSGHFKISREVWDHPAFKAGEMTQREAFFWIVSEAAWKPHTRRIGAAVVELDRGQLAASTRYMAKMFQWTEARVRRYLKMLAEWQIIDAASDAGVTVITVCNYDRYQGERRTSDAPSDAEATQHRRTSDAKEKAGKQGSKEPNGSYEEARPDLDDAVSAYRTICVPAGLPDVRTLSAKRRKALTARLTDEGPEVWRQACQRAAASSFCRGENDRGWKLDFDDLTNPTKFNRLLEGKYDDRAPSNPSGPSASRGRAASQQRKSAWVSALEELGGGDASPERPERPGGDAVGEGGYLRLAHSG